MAVVGWRGLPALVFLLSLLAPTWAASLVPTSGSNVFPACGVSCTVLQQAQDSCTANPNQSTWVSCFCQSALLVQLKSSGALCTSCTSASDQSLVSSWYNDYCKSGGNLNADNNANPATTTTTSTAGATADAAKAANEHPTWWTTHYRWIVMLIVIVIGFSILAAVGIWFKRRYDAKRPGLYHGGGNPSSSSGVFRGGSGGLSPALGPGPGPGSTAYGPSPAPVQPRGVASNSVASSSRVDVAAKAASAPPPVPTPVPTPSSGSRSRLQKPPVPPAADVETREISRP